MKTRILCLATFCLSIFCMACSESHLISNEAERQIVERDFRARAATLRPDQLAKVDNPDLSLAQREALTFIYAYMPLADLADHDFDFYLKCVDQSLQAREEMPWGSSVPEREFRHFVLPPRINNENLDSCRWVFYKELKPRVEGLSMRDAVLEVNHWCHEKVTYTPSDSRTSSPLASVKTAYGRCGEESTFTVAALRSVGIPARQVYTPRWAHTDDNHAWVEAWVDGQWYFLGACEPAPVLNLGWFNAPASRGMLMHTKVFGYYAGPEEVVRQTATFTEINVIDNYAPTASLSVAVVDTNGQAAANANVEFKLYNYGEFYTVAAKTADQDGYASLTAGKGDMIVWASKDGRYGYGKASFGTDSALTITLSQTLDDVKIETLNIVPPAEGANLPEVSPEAQAKCDRRLAQEDSIRAAYVATFMSDTQARDFAKTIGTDLDATASLITASRGNHATLVEFLSSAPEDKRADAIDLLQQLSAKDLRDVSLPVLNDHFYFTAASDSPHFSKYIRNPRVSDEMIVPYKQFFAEAFTSEERQAFAANPMALVSWVADNISINNDINLNGPAITPVGVWNAKTADARSRDIFFVALARSMNIAARVDEVTGKVQIFNGDDIIGINFEAPQEANALTGVLRVDYEPTALMPDPKYYYHFTISKIQDNGTLQLLNYEEGATWKSLLKNGITLDAGTYAMVSGTRLANGGVLSHMEIFRIEPGKTTKATLQMRQAQEDVQVIGSFNSESIYHNVALGKDVSVLSTTGRGYFAVSIIGVGQEPTNHAMRDIAAAAKELEAWGRSIIVLFPNEEQYKRFNPAEFPGLPSNITYGIDIDGKIQNQIATEMRLKANTLPITIIADTFNRIVFTQQGYTIGLGQQMAKIIAKL